MATVTPVLSPPPPFSASAIGWTAADMQERLGQVPLDRILVVPAGYCHRRRRGANPQLDRLHLRARGRDPRGENRGILRIASGGRVIPLSSSSFSTQPSLAWCLRRTALCRFSGLVRAADVSFIRWQRLPGGKLPESPIPISCPTWQ